MNEGMSSGAPGTDTLLSSVWFQVGIALIVLSFTFAPQIYRRFQQACSSDQSDDSDEANNDWLPAQSSGGKSGKRGKNRKNNGNNNNNNNQSSYSKEMDQQLRELQQQQQQLRRVQEETQRLKQQAEDEARATKQQAKVDAEEIARRVMEEMDSKQQQYEMAAVRRAAEAEADALKAAATQEAARLRKNAEEEAASLRKLAEEEAAMLRVVETKKREMEKEVATAAAQAREKMAGEVEAIRKRAEAEVLELKQKATKEAAAMFQQAEWSVKQQRNFSESIPAADAPSPKPPRMPTPPSRRPSKPSKSKGGGLTINPHSPPRPDQELPKAATPPRSPVIGIEREERAKQQPSPPMAHESAESADLMPASGASTSSGDWRVQGSSRNQAPAHQTITPHWTAGWPHPQGDNRHSSGKGQMRNHSSPASIKTGDVMAPVPDMTQPVPYKMKLCTKFMQSGHCKRASGCTYAHGDHEIGMPRPAQLEGVTLGEMNARKKNKNTVEHGQHGGGQHGGGGGYQFTSVNSSRPMAAEPYRQPAPEPVQQHMPAPSNPTRPAKPNSSQAANQWDKPPKITASKRAPARVETSRGGESVADRSARLTDHIQGKKEPSPFLPLSPSLDEPWLDPDDRSKTMSWADSAVTPSPDGPHCPP